MSKEDQMLENYHATLRTEWHDTSIANRRKMSVAECADYIEAIGKTQQVINYISTLEK